MIDDGRAFGWQRTPNGRTPVTPVIIWDKLYGCAKNMVFVGDLHPLRPEQYDMTLAELAALYPAPEVQPE